MRLPQRLRDRRFWEIQLLVLVAAAPHYIIELVGFTEPLETLDGLAITLNVIPLLYAAIAFGWEGAFLTGLLISAVVSPGIAVWHHSSLHWIGEVGQLMVVLPMGLLVAWRVDREARQRQRAEQTSAGLRLLNEAGVLLGQTIELEERLPAVLRRLREGLAVEAIWLSLEPESADQAGMLIVEPLQKESSVRALPPDILQPGAASSEAACRRERVVTVPLMTEGRVLGSLGMMAPEGRDPTPEQLDLLATAAQEVRVAIENATLYRERQESLESYARQVTQAQEEERLRIARELHDETAQELVHLVRKLEGIAAFADRTPTWYQHDLLRWARETLRSVRRFSRDLRPSVLDDLGLVPAIELALEGANGSLAGGARLSVTGRPRRLDSAVEIALFRIAQEALHNVEKHAAATSATVELRFADDAVRLAVSDDGRGYDFPGNVSELARAGKLGVLGMKERAELIGGVFAVRSTQGGGCQVTVEVHEQVQGGRSRGPDIR
ncbi:MAG: GAF domain-containing sensor histidine kinase [Chloroflexota bacterium]|nr:GAF domain-containing sensor histidine kinase [Chloroflexota bacterium]